MNLAQRLTEIRHAFETGDTPREIVDLLNAHVDTLIAANVNSQSLAIGDLAPMEVSVQSDSGLVPLATLCDKRFLVVTWFRGNW